MKSGSHKIVIIYDCPWDENDKPWLYNDLSEIGGGIEVKHIEPNVRLSTLARSGKTGLLKRYYINYSLIRRVIHLTKKDDTIITWNPYVGMFAKQFCKDRYVMTLNWLSPGRNSFLKLKQNYFRSEGVSAGVNSYSTIQKWCSAIHVVGMDKKFFYIPDVYESNTEYRKPSFDKEQYCFTGGINNRNWAFIIKFAAQHKKMKFVCVALKDDFEKSVGAYKDIPDNVKVLYNISTDKYYEMLSKAYLMILPLKEDRVSGLINVIRSIHYGVIPVTANIDGVSQYYPKEEKKLLYSLNDYTSFSNTVENAVHMKEQEYSDTIRSLQHHLKDNFSSEYASKCVRNALYKMWKY